MNLGGGEIVVLLYLVMMSFGLWIAYTLVSAIVRISRAFESASRSLERNCKVSDQ